MKRYEKAVLAAFCVLLLLVLAAYVLTGGWAAYFQQSRNAQSGGTGPNLVDMRPLTTAQTLAQLAVTSGEREYAQDALRLGDHLVDLNFAAALRDAAANPPTVDEQTRTQAQRVTTASAAVKADQDRIAALSPHPAKVPEKTKDGDQDRLGLEQAQLTLDQDELQDAQQDLIRAGGDKQAAVQQLLDQHEASEGHSTASKGAIATDTSSIELTRAGNIEAEVGAWLSLRSKEQQLAQAQQQASSRAAKFSASHDALEKKLAAEDAQNKVFHPAASSPSPATSAKSAGNSMAMKYAMAFLHQMTLDQQNLSDFDKRIETELQLAAVYGDWIALVNVREEAFLHRFFYSLFWILLIALVVLILNHWVQRIFANIALERRQLHTLRAVMLFAVQALGLVIILVIIFGVPTNFATAIGLVGAGLAVGLKDFIVGFFGWFILIGKGGIRPGDWVEINGIGGEVLEIGLFQTVLLETGTLTDAGRPTGRKVSFVNSYAVEGHYFNFSTSGQWLWDEVEVQIPDNVEPYQMAEAIQKIAADETATNARLAEEDWTRGTPASAHQSFSAEPSFTVRPTGSGVSVFVRYITRVNERHEVRSRIYRAAVDLLRSTKTPDTAVQPPPPLKAAGEPA
jgi:small-conductance mechanosensitive channel